MKKYPPASSFDPDKVNLVDLYFQQGWKSYIGFLNTHYSKPQDQRLNKLQYTLILLWGNIQRSQTNDPQNKVFVIAILKHYLDLLERSSRLIKARYISTLLDKTGLIIQNYMLTRSDANPPNIISSELVNRLLAFLDQADDLAPQDIANSLHGLGLLAQVDYLDGSINSAALESLLAKLPTLMNLRDQHFSTALHGLALLAKHQRLSVPLSSEVIKALLLKLKQLKPKSQALSISLYSLGLLIEYRVINGSVEATYIKTLFMNLLGMKYLPQHLSNALTGLVNITKHDELSFSITPEMLSSLLKFMMEQVVKHFELSSFILSLGQLAEAGYVNPPTVSINISKILGKLWALPDLDTQAVGNVFLGLSKLALSEISLQVDPKAIWDGIRVILDPKNNASTRHRVNSLYGVCVLVHKNLLAIEQCTPAIMQMLDSLKFQPLHPIEISFALFGLILINFQLDPNRLNLFLDQYTQNLKESDIESHSRMAQVYLMQEREIPAALSKALQAHQPEVHNLQDRLVNELNQYGTATAEAMIGAWFVDILFEKDGKRYVIELDGTHHSEHKRTQIKDQRRDQWLKQQGYEIIRIPHPQQKQGGLNYYLDQIKKVCKLPQSASLTTSGSNPKGRRRSNKPQDPKKQAISAKNLK